MFWAGRYARKHRLWDVLRWADNIKMALELGCGDSNLIRLSDFGIEFNRQVLVNTFVYAGSVKSEEFFITRFQERCSGACAQSPSF